MANEKTLKTRIKLRYDTLANWNAKDPTLLEGEIAVVAIPTNSSVEQVQGTTPPQILFKIGAKKSDGNLYKFSELKWASGMSADVYNWAKQEAINTQAFIEAKEDLITSTTWTLPSTYKLDARDWPIITGNRDSSEVKIGYPISHDEMGYCHYLIFDYASGDISQTVFLCNVTCEIGSNIITVKSSKKVYIPTPFEWDTIKNRKDLDVVDTPNDTGIFYTTEVVNGKPTLTKTNWSTVSSNSTVSLKYDNKIVVDSYTDEDNHPTLELGDKNNTLILRGWFERPMYTTNDFSLKHLAFTDESLSKVAHPIKETDKQPAENKLVFTYVDDHESEPITINNVEHAINADKLGNKSASEYATKADVAGAVQYWGVVKQLSDLGKDMTSTSTLPTTIGKGDFYRVGKPFELAGTPLTEGSLLIANKDNPDPILGELGYAEIRQENGDGTVTEIKAGTGLTTGDKNLPITSKGTINLKKSTATEIGGGRATPIKEAMPSGKNYEVKIDNTGKYFVAVPWENNTDTNTAHTHSAGNGLSMTGSGGISGIVTYAVKDYNTILTSKNATSGSGNLEDMVGNTIILDGGSASDWKQN